MLLFTSVYFFFLAAVFLLYWPLQRWRAASLGILLFANYFFYAKWGLFYLFFIPGASIIDFALARGLQRSQNGRLRLALVAVSILMNVGLLATLKYVPFFLSTWTGLTGQPAPAWHWTFPLGVSFYAFQAMSYTIDVYRRDAKATPSLLAYLTAVSFFPTVLAGPITQPARLLPQLEKRKWIGAEEGGKALFLIGLGLVKKLLIADYLAENLVNRVFDFPKLYSGFEVLVGVYGYALQLYYDFSGYSDIAVGSALMLGFALPANFNRPYTAENIGDFWRRWHISLSNWLRDYLYFSLPGKRGKVMPYVNLAITMVIGGLWHGASWTFVVWGALHGVALAMQRAVQVARGNPKPRQEWWAAALRTCWTVQFVCFAWIFFRAPGIESAWAIIERIATLSFDTANLSGPVLLIFAIGAVAHFLPKSAYERPLRWYTVAPFYAQAAILTLLVLSLQYVATTGSAPFIYTKF